MPPSLVECIPNFSEARRPEVVTAILEAIGSIRGAHILDHSSDLDHNRTVVTYVAPPDAALEAAFAGIAKAAELISLDQHRGEHPRLGAADVVPFVPLAGVSMQDCVELARSLGQRVGEELRLPVYLYEAAATRPDRVNLADIRRGEYEKLKEEIGRNPERAPDFGPEQVGPAGAVVIGARAPLIAFNAYLNTPDVGVAKKIAKAVRHSTGGFRFVKALGLLVEGQAQVSMNMTDYTQTPLARTVELIRREAARYGATITRTELVGLIPQAALVDSAQWYLQLDGLKPEQVLENRLWEVASQSTEPATTAPPSGQVPANVEAFSALLAAGSPTPGGGAAAAAAASMAAGLVEMVARLTIGKKRYMEVERRMREIAASAQGYRDSLNRAVVEDSAAFEAVIAARKLARGASEEATVRERAVQAAYRDAVEVPLNVGRACVELLSLALSVAGQGNVNALSDAGTSAHLARAALASAALNVRANAAEFLDRQQARGWLEELAQLEDQAAHRFAAVEEVLLARQDSTA